MLYDNGFACNYDELITYYPKFYRNVFEMDAILRAYGDLADGMEDSIERVLNNTLIDTADEETITRLEKFYRINLVKERSLEDRRRMLKACRVGNGKLSASVLAAMITSYTGADTEIVFEPYDEAGNNRLEIRFERGAEQTIYIIDILTLLSKKIPAHLVYQAMMTYRIPCCVEVPERRHYLADYPITGTIPDVAKIGDINQASAEAGATVSSYGADYHFCGDDLFAG